MGKLCHISRGNARRGLNIGVSQYLIELSIGCTLEHPKWAISREQEHHQRLHAEETEPWGGASGVLRAWVSGGVQAGWNDELILS